MRQAGMHWAFDAGHRAHFDVPPTDNSAVDGYAVRFITVAGKRRAIFLHREILGLAPGDRAGEGHLHAVRGAAVDRVVLDADGRFRNVNERLATVNGASRAEHLGRTGPAVVGDAAQQTAQVGLLQREQAGAELPFGGEAPGATEDETGRPFVGQAGKLLTDILRAIKLSREEVFIANVMKHRPPGNRNPTPDEITACSPYLLRQVELIRPKVILALGTFAAQTLLDTKVAIGKLRGLMHWYHGTPLIATYHPAALLRNPGWKKPTWEDVKLVRRILDSVAA